MKGFIVYATYKEREDGTYVEFVGRLENNQSFIAHIKHEPYFFIQKKDLSKVKNLLLKYKVHETKDKTFEQDEVVKISHVSQTDLNKIVEVIHKKKIDTFEADIKPHYRLMMEKDIRGSIEISGDYQPTERVDRFYQNPEIKSTNFVPNLKMVSIDIESDKDSDALFCIGLYSEKYKHVFMVSDKKLQNATSCKDEAEVLTKFKEKLIDLDPDIITGWNITDFDFPYLKKKFEENKVPFDIGRDNSETRMRISNSFFKDSTITLMGRQVLDGLNLIQDPFIKEAPSIKNADFNSWTLEDVSQTLLNEGKFITGKDRHEIITTLYKKDPQKIVDYNLQDCKLAFDILVKTKTIELAIERTQLTGMLLDRLTASIAAFDSLYIREARSRGIVSPSTRFSNKEERIKGGYVMDSKAGIYHNVVVLDFKSLYPSIIRTFNIDPASFLKTKEKGSIESPNHAHFKNTEGILPQIIDTLHQAREKAKKEKRELASYAIKIIMNSFFGVLASPNCRYFSLDIANAITHFGQYIIKLTAEKIREQGYTVIYSDTDAVFVEINKTKEETQHIGKNLQQYINEFYQKMVKKEYQRTSFLEIEFKRHYLSFMLPALRHTEKGSKKRYAGLLEENGKEKLEIVGLEAIRGDWTDAAQEFQRELLLHVFHRKEFIPFIRTYVTRLKSGKMDAKLVYRKSIRKSLEEYTKTTPPHVKAARKLDKLESNVIEYYLTTDGPEPIQKLKHDIDYEHYIHKQIEPIANTILAFFKKKFDDVIKGSEQTTLFT